MHIHKSGVSVKSNLSKLIFFVFLQVSQNLAYAQSASHERQCTLSIFFAIDYNQKTAKSHLEQMEKSETDWILSAPSNEDMEKALIRKFPNVKFNEEFIAKSRLTELEAMVARVVTYELPSLPAQKVLENGAKKCMAIGRTKWASLVSDLLNEAIADYSTEIARQQHLNGLVNKLNDLKRNHPYYSSCPSYKAARQQCATAGNYDTCMNIKFGTSHKSVAESSICSF